jgi:hypothetical protein
MKILAIDPGNEESAYVLWDGKKILDFGKVSNFVLLENKLKPDDFDFPYDHCCIEMVASYGMPVGKTVFDTVFWIGRFFENCHAVCLIYRKEVKIHLCGQTRAKDSNIIQALKDRFGDKGTKKAPGLTYGLSKDVWQAFALAVYYYDTQGHLQKADLDDLPY